jgi:hypothetical protein
MMVTPPRKRARSASIIAIAVIIILLAAAYFVLDFTGSPKSTTKSPQSPIVLTSPVPPTQQVTASAFGEFGSSVAVSGDTIIVGAPNETVGGEADAGHVYVFNSDSGALVTTLVSPYPQQDGVFGWSVAANGTSTIVGAPGENANGKAGAGHVYVFNTTTGLLLRTLTSPNAQANGAFGYSVAASNTLVVVGALHEIAESLPDAGRAYAFNLLTGTSADNLSSPSPAILGWFGRSVAVAGAYIVVGAPHEPSDGLPSAGRAYVFNATSGKIVQSLGSPNAQAYGIFGLAVAVNEAIVWVGAPFENASGLLSAGHVYVFATVNGTLLDTLESPNFATGGNFGSSVAADSGTFVVSADNEVPNILSPGTGRVYSFDSMTRSLINTLVAPSGHLGFGFGDAVAVEPGVIGVGAPFTNNCNGLSCSSGIAFAFS